MSQQGQQQGGFGLVDAARTTSNLYFLILGALITPFVATFRHTHGSRYFDPVSTLSGYLLLLFWGGFHPHCDPRPGIFLAQAFLAVLLIRGVQAARRLRFPIPGIHSRYSGTPYLWVRWFKESTVKESIEPPLCLLCGVFTLPANEGLGYYILSVGVALMLANAAQSQYRARRREQMEDARIEAALMRGGLEGRGIVKLGKTYVALLLTSPRQYQCRPNETRR